MDPDNEARIKRLEYALALNDARTVADKLTSIERRLHPFEKAASLLRDIVVPMLMAAMSVALGWITWRNTAQRETEVESKLKATQKQLDEARATLEKSAKSLVEMRMSEYHQLFQHVLSRDVLPISRVAALAAVCMQGIDPELRLSAKHFALAFGPACDAGCKEKDQECLDACNQVRCVAGQHEEGDDDCKQSQAVCQLTDDDRTASAQGVRAL
jgi:hypothetical protein